MKSKNNSKYQIENLNTIFITIITTFLLSGGLMNIINKDVDYLKLEYSGLYMLGIHTLISAIIFIFLINFLFKNINIMLSFSIIFFFTTLLIFHLEDGLRLGISLILIISILKTIGKLNAGNRFISINGNFSNSRKYFTIEIFVNLLIIITKSILVFTYLKGVNFSNLFKLLYDKVPLIKDYKVEVSIAFLAVFTISLIFFIFFNNGDLSQKKLNILAFVLFIFQSLVIGRILYYRYTSLNTPTYDFNLFAQMFYSMSKGLGQMTTLERNMPMSHLHVHISPIFYLLLPFYKITMSPAILQILGAIIVSSGIFPLIKLAYKYKIQKKIILLFSIIYVFSPAIVTSNFYDLHENLFLVPLLLWLIYYFECDNIIGISIFTLLTLLVKEDAAIYIWTLALFVILDRKKIKLGLFLIITSGIHFAYCLWLLKIGGQGAMLGRFENFISIKKLSILSIPYTIFKNPGFFFKTIFQNTKIIYFLQMLLPLGFIPALNSRFSKFILFIPLIVMNLLSDYPYQSDIMFQYNYGSYVLLLFMFLLFFKEKGYFLENTSMKNKSFSNIILGILLSLSIAYGFIFTMPYVINYEYFKEYYYTNKDTITKMKLAMDTIPNEASVLTSPFLTGYLSKRDTLYDIEYNFINDSYYKADYIAIDLRDGFYEKDPKILIERFKEDGYTISKFEEDLIIILSRN